MRNIRLLLAASAIASLSACLNSDLERGLAGAGAGALVAGVPGAIVGGAAGALCDEVTNICR